MKLGKKINFLVVVLKILDLNCHKIKNTINKIKKTNCNMHPHNYYLEILTELGIFGYYYFYYNFFSIIYKFF